MNSLSYIPARNIPGKSSNGFLNTTAKPGGDVYPYGMLKPGRYYNPDDYDFGFNGMRADDELKGTGNSYTTFFRQYDPRLGVWFSTDPVVHPWMSSYAAFNLNPILYKDPRGNTGEEGGKDGKKEGDIATVINLPLKVEIVADAPPSGISKFFSTIGDALREADRAVKYDGPTYDILDLSGDSDTWSIGIVFTGDRETDNPAAIKSDGSGTVEISKDVFDAVDIALTRFAGVSTKKKNIKNEKIDMTEVKIKQESLSVTKIGNNITGTQITVITHQKVEVTLRVYVKTVQNQKVVVVNVDKYKPTPDFNFNEGEGGSSAQRQLRNQFYELNDTIHETDSTLEMYNIDWRKVK